jgi:hypothetical protein
MVLYPQYTALEETGLRMDDETKSLDCARDTAGVLATGITGLEQLRCELLHHETAGSQLQ